MLILSKNVDIMTEYGVAKMCLQIAVARPAKEAEKLIRKIAKRYQRHCHRTAGLHSEAQLKAVRAIYRTNSNRVALAYDIWTDIEETSVVDCVDWNTSEDGYRSMTEQELASDFTEFKLPV